MYDPNARCKISPSVYSVWRAFGGNVQTHEILSSDLSIGYDVLMIRNKYKFINLCEDMDERDRQPTKILFSSFSKYGSYDPSHIKDDSDILDISSLDDSETDSDILDISSDSE